MTQAVRRLPASLLCLLSLAACRGEHYVPMPRQIVDLSPTITADLNIQRLGSHTLNFLGTPGRTRSTPVLPDDPNFAYGIRSLHLLSDTGAHLDAPARLLRGGETPAQINLDRLFGPARIVDLRWHDRHSPIQITDLELAEIQEGDVVILFVGYEPPVGDDWPLYTDLSTQASEWLVGKKIRALATDMPAIVRFDEIDTRMRKGLPPEKVWEEYLPLFQARIPIVVGLVNLDSLVREARVAFVGFPLSLADGGGAPMRAAALVY